MPAICSILVDVSWRSDVLGRPPMPLACRADRCVSCYPAATPAMIPLSSKSMDLNDRLFNTLPWRLGGEGQGEGARWLVVVQPIAHSKLALVSADECSVLFLPRIRDGAEGPRPAHLPSPAASCGRPSPRVHGILCMPRGGSRKNGKFSFFSWKRNDPLGMRAALCRRTRVSFVSS